MRLLDHGFAVIASGTRSIVDEESASKMMSTMVVRKLFLGNNNSCQYCCLLVPGIRGHNMAMTISTFVVSVLKVRSMANLRSAVHIWLHR
ncbi:NF-kappa-B inhibitor alpha-like [Aphis craccivora]|uniref:NF-kappa-B inhibitor alpha-like n=1 Tax=Aphis craccivora TaxID=307492 RepID=A0A6G0ZF84_APHCR|nr:NF-kappa-B inhibitor alpha-like [Aphis craccivora]